VFLVAGEPGIGKSRLAEELIAEARARGARVLVGRCWEAGGAPAYWPWVQSVRAYVRGTEPDALRSQVGAGAADLAHLLPELRELFPDIPKAAPPESEAARFRLFEVVASLLRTVARVKPLVLVLDDVHVADEPSLLLLRFVARQIVDAPLLVVCAYRDVDPTLRDPLTSAVAALVREPHTCQIVLGGLTEPDVADYIDRATHTEPSSQLVAAIRAQTDGNPLYVVELVQLLTAEGGIDHPDAQLKIPLGVRAVIGQRIGRLSPRCRSLLAAASVIGREFGLDALTQLSGLSRDDVLDVLDEALAERVLGEAPGLPGRLRFGHALIRDTIYDELTATRKLRLHRRAGEALEALYAADLEPRLAELAQHFVAAASGGAADKALEYARRAGDRAARQLAYEEATRLYRTALGLVDEPTARCEVVLALGDVQARAGDSADSRQALREAAEIAERLRLSEHLARAALGYGGRILWHKTRDDEYLVPMLERALILLGDADSALRVRLLTRIACGPHLAGSAHKAALSRDALESARRIGDPATLAYALDGYIPTNESPRNTRRFLGLATELLEVARELGDKERVFDAHEHRLGRLLDSGRWLPRGPSWSPWAGSQRNFDNPLTDG
jgi:predicted ATPase